MSLLRPQNPLQRLARPAASLARFYATQANVKAGAAAAAKPVKKTTIVKAAAPKAAVSKPAPKSTVVPPRPVATKPVATKPVATKPVAPKPAAAKPVSPITPKPYAPPTVARKTTATPSRPAAPLAPVPKPKPLNPNSPEYQKSYKSLARRWLAGLIATPVFLVTSYYLYDRLILGNERKIFQKEPPKDERDALAKTI